MKIEVQLAHPIEAKSTIEDQKITIEPRFRRSFEAKPIAYVMVTSGRGEGVVRRFVIYVSASNGKLSCREVKEVEARFDKDNRSKA